MKILRLAQQTLTFWGYRVVGSGRHKVVEKKNDKMSSAVVIDSWNNPKNKLGDVMRTVEIQTHAHVHAHAQKMTPLPRNLFIIDDLEKVEKGETRKTHMKGVCADSSWKNFNHSSPLKKGWALPLPRPPPPPPGGSVSFLTLPLFIEMIQSCWKSE